MCGRYNLRATPEELQEYFDLFREPAPFPPRYNIAPTQTVLTIRVDQGQRNAVPLRWGLVPSWAKDAKSGAKMINARAETVLEKPTYKAAFRRRRCLVPASGFYEWRAGTGKAKQPFHIHQKDGELLAFAGLWDRWEKGDAPFESCTIITTEANDLMQSLHNRMPVILPKNSWNIWLDPEVPAESLSELLSPYEADDLVAEAVSTIVNNVRNDTPACIEPVDIGDG